MAGKDIIMLRQEELKRLHIIRKVSEGILKQKDAAEILLITDRQLRRVIKRVSEEGDRGIAHRSRGKASNRRLLEKTREKVIRLYRQRYKGFGPTLFCEKGVRGG